MSALKHKGKGPQALTANGLKTGPVVYLNADLKWTTSFKEALITEDQETIERMGDFRDTAENENEVVGVYFIDISADTGLPVRYREKFRANGPSYDPGHPTHIEKAAQGAEIIGA